MDVNLGQKDERGSRCSIRNTSAGESNLLTGVLEGPPHQLLYCPDHLWGSFSQPFLYCIFPAFGMLYCLTASRLPLRLFFMFPKIPTAGEPREAADKNLQLVTWAGLQSCRRALQQCMCPHRLLPMSYYRHYSSERCFAQSCGYRYYIQVYNPVSSESFTLKYFFLLKKNPCYYAG